MNNFNYKEAYDDLRCRLDALRDFYKEDEHIVSCISYCLKEAKECGERWAVVDTDWQNTVRLHTNVCEGLINLENNDERA